VHWIDHFVVGTNDMVRWEKFAEEALGGHLAHKGGLNTGQYNRGGYIRSFYDVGRHELAAFLQLDLLPPPRPLGQGLIAMASSFARRTSRATCAASTRQASGIPTPW